MDYAVALDGAGQAARLLMGPAGVSGIPHAFIVGEPGLLLVRCPGQRSACCWDCCDCCGGMCAIPAPAARFDRVHAGHRGIPLLHSADGGGVIRHHGHPMEPRFAQVLDQVCSQAAAAGGGGGKGSEGGAAAGAGAAAAEPRQQRELPPVTASREELQALPVRHLDGCCSAVHGMPACMHVAGADLTHHRNNDKPRGLCLAASRLPVWGQPAVHRNLIVPPPAPLQVRQLKQLLEERGISYADLNEKGELVGRILERCSRVTYYA